MARLPELLDAVERGETIVITRRGRRIARLVPDAVIRREQTEQALAELAELRKAMPTLTLDEIRAARHEGHDH
jgi:prevent-host-death family protein